MKNILFIVGSMREKSFNKQLADEASKLFEGKAEVSFLDYKNLPYMNQDIEYPAPEELAKVRETVAKADGIWIVTPEYNLSYPGVLKNLLDWLSRPLKPLDFAGPTSMKGKKVTISGAAGRSEAKFSRAKLRELLGVMGTTVMKLETGVSIGQHGFETDVLTLSDEAKDSLKAQAEELLGAI